MTNKNKKNWGGSKFFKYFEEFIISPLGNFSTEYGKLVITISTICICLFITRPMTSIIELPKALEDTVGDIPIIEHFDDGDVEIIPESYRGGWGNGGFVTGVSVYTSQWVYR